MDHFSNSGCGLKEAIYPSIHSSTAPVCSELLDEIVIRGGGGGGAAAGWIKEYDDVPRHRPSLNPIGLSAACSSVRSRCYHSISSLCGWVGGGVCVGGGGGWFGSGSLANQINLCCSLHLKGQTSCC